MERVKILTGTMEEVFQTPKFRECMKKIGQDSILSFRGAKEHTEYLYNLQEKMKKILPKEVLVK